jgi:hypothetical protein
VATGKYCTIDFAVMPVTPVSLAELRALWLAALAMRLLGEVTETLK